MRFHTFSAIYIHVPKLCVISINHLSGAYFTAVDLANFARELDEDERMRMAEGGIDSPQYLRY